ncbi:hypothetical protein A0J61_11928, partial [Choanephora cucurbitarum]
NAWKQLRTLADISRTPTYRYDDFWLENMILARYYHNKSRKEPQKSARKKASKNKSDKGSKATKRQKKVSAYMTMNSNKATLPRLHHRLNKNQYQVGN